MVKMQAQFADGGTGMLLGLSFRDLAHLANEGELLIEVPEGARQLLLFSRETDEGIELMVRAKVNPGTEVHDLRRPVGEA